MRDNRWRSCRCIGRGVESKERQKQRRHKSDRLVGLNVLWLMIVMLSVKPRATQRNRILTYYDEPAWVRGPTAVHVHDGRSSVRASGLALRLDLSRPDGSTTRYGCSYQPRCRYPNPTCRTPLIPTWKTWTCDGIGPALLCTGPHRTENVHNAVSSILLPIYSQTVSNFMLHIRSFTLHYKLLICKIEWNILR